jgi:photosystem II stability/assembly factor-like uncharacterized protein
MNDEELERSLRDELRQRIVPGDAPDRLFAHVARLGSEGASSGQPTPGRVARLHRRIGVLGSLAAAAGIAALIVAGLFWRPSHGPIAATPSGLPSAVGSPTASTPQETEAPAVAWHGLPVDALNYGQLDGGFGWVNGTATGQPEALYITTDDGLTWQQHPVPYTDTDNHSGIQFVDRLHGYVAVSLYSEATSYTNTVLRTSDGGLTWTRSVVIDHSGFNTYELDMTDAQHGWLLLVNSSGVWWLYGTTDGAVTWSPLVDTANLKTAPRDLHFTSAQEGWGYAKSGDLVHSLDGGKTWTAAVLPVPSGYSIGGQDAAPSGTSGKLVLHGFADQTGTEAWAAATWTSADGGQTWKLDSFEKLSDVVALQDQTYSAVGSSTLAGYGQVAGANKGIDSVFSNLVLEEPDGQTSTFAASGLYSFVPTGTTGMLEWAHATSATAAWVAIDTCAPAGYFGSGFGFRPCRRLMATTDGGKSWRPMLWAPSATGSQPTPVAQQVSPCCTMDPVGERQRTPEPLTGWLDAAHGWAVVGTNLQWTVDGGKTWDTGSPLPASGTIQFIDADHGWLAASDSSDPGTTVSVRAPVFRTSDGGRTWTSIDLPAPAQPSWTWAHFTDLSHGVVAQCPQAEAGQDVVECEAFTTDDGGMTFQGPVKETYATPIAWLTPEVGYGIHTASNVLVLEMSSDGGRTWASQNLQTLPGAQSSYPLAMDLTPGGSGRLVVQCLMADSSVELARYETADGGRTWHLAWSGAGPQVRLDVARIAGGGIVAVSSGTFWGSSDFGMTWSQLSKVAEDVHDFVFVDATTGWMVRAPGYAQSPDALLATTDGGRTWHVVLTAPSIITNP